MILDCPRKELLDAVQLAGAPATGRQTTLPMLQSLLVEADNDRIRLVGCDGEMWVERTIPSVVTETGALTLNARLLNEILGRLPDGDIHIEQANSSSVRMSLGSTDFRMVTGHQAEDFPEVPGVAAEAQLTMNFGEFCKLIDSVEFAVAPETQGRPILTGVLLSYDGEVLRAVATDTHRLAVCAKKLPGLGNAVEVVVPLRALSVIKRLPISTESELTLTIGERRLIVATDGARVVAQLLEGTFPPYQRVIPQETTRQWIMDREELLAAIRRELILAREDSNRIILRSEGDTVYLTAKSIGLGEGKDEVSVVKEGDDIEIAFNGKYLLDALEVIATPSAVLEMTERDRAAVLKPSEGEPSFLCVIMPMAM